MMTPTQRFSDFIVHIQNAWPYGLRIGLREAWLSERCTHHFMSPLVDADRLQRAVAEAEGHVYAPSPRERRKQRCADAALSFALALEAGRYGNAPEGLASEWFDEAMIWSLPGEHEADVAYAIRVLDGRIAVPDSENPERERRMAELSLISAAWDGYGPAQVAAAKLLLDGRMSDFALRTKHGPAGEAYALLRLAEAAGADAGPALEAAKARLRPEALKALDAEILAFGETRPAGTTFER
jgi:hypothetical protein